MRVRSEIAELNTSRTLLGDTEGMGVSHMQSSGFEFDEPMSPLPVLLLVDMSDLQLDCGSRRLLDAQSLLG
jgi:hypothetical protein